MAGIIERIGSLAGTELGKAANLAHNFYSERMSVHSHTGRALVETAAEVARNHPNLVGIGVGLLVEQLLAEEKRRHDAHIANGDHPNALPPRAPPHTSGKDKPKAMLPHHPVVHHDLIKLSTLRPGRVALEVFGGILLLKLASSGARMFRHKRQGEVWFAPAARVRLWSGTFAAYYLVKSMRSPKLSAWRNAAVALFATDALKPVLKVPKQRRGQVSAAPSPVALSAPALIPEPEMHSFEPEPHLQQTMGVPKHDPRPMPVWPSQAQAQPEPQGTSVVHAPEPMQAPPMEPSDGHAPPG